jgi:hypothetical protein
MRLVHVMNQPHATFRHKICDFDGAERLPTPWWLSCETERVHVNRSGFMHEMVFPISKTIKIEQNFDLLPTFSCKFAENGRTNVTRGA